MPVQSYNNPADKNGPASSGAIATLSRNGSPAFPGIQQMLRDRLEFEIQKQAAMRIKRMFPFQQRQFPVHQLQISHIKIH